MSVEQSSILWMQNACSGYGRNVVLHDVGFSVTHGSICGVIGPNGAGKTTLLRTLYGFIGLRSGRVAFEGRDISNLGIKERLGLGLGYVPQERNVFPNLTVTENLALAMGSLSGAERRERFRSRLDYVFSLFPRLAERRDQKAGLMSGGEQRMVAIGIGLMMKPRVLLLDEPTTGLSPALVGVLMSTLRRLTQDEGITSVIVEQNVPALLNIADSLYLVKDGKCRVFDDRPSALDKQKIWEYM